MLKSFRPHLSLLKSDRRGVTALEYGLLAGVLGVAIALAATNLGTALTNTFTNIANQL
jgi:pilus assembly protein Flp/PilA